VTTEGTLHERLSRPFNEKELKFFPVAMSRDGKTAKVGSYVDARAVEDRLDEVIGPGLWQTTYRCIDPGDKAVECTLSLLIDGVWVGKADVGYPNEAKDADNPDKEPWKAAYSDALKRAAVQWGVGRYIYSLELERDWLPVDQYKKFTEQPRIKTPVGARQATGQAGVGRPTQSQAASLPPAPAPAPRTFWDVTREMGYRDEEVTALSQQMFEIKEPRQLTAEQKRQLVTELETRKKKEVA
jgi:hypothetical protein